MSVDWQKRTVELENTVYELENQVKTLLRSEFKMYESQKRLEKYLGRIQEFNQFSIKASEVNNAKELLSEAILFCQKVYCLERANLSFVGEFDSFSLLFENEKLFDEDPLMMDTRHGMIDYSQKVIFIDDESTGEIKEYLKQVFNIEFKKEDRWILFSFRHANNHISLILKAKHPSQIPKVTDLPSREDNQLFLALHRALQNELSNKLMREELEHKISQRTREAENKNTMLRRSLLTLQELQNDLIQSGKLAAIGEISTSIAHEINNPLFVIQGRISKLRKMIENDQLDKKQMVDYLDNVDEMQKRIVHIINGLSSFTRDSRFELEEDFNVSEILSDLNVFLGERLKTHKVKFEIHDKSEGAKLKAKRVEFSQIMINLVSNAIDAIQDLPERWVKIETSAHDGELSIRVTDSGNIPRDKIGKLFKPFYSSKPSGKGTGLGLSISRRIVERYNGSLILDLEADNTCFVVTFPIAG